jgi:hypothetical protein
MIVLRSPILTQLHAYWERKRGARPAPARKEIDPAEIVPLLPHLFLIEAVGTPSRFRYRLIGTAVVELTGRDLTGHFVDENLEPAKFAALVEPYETVIRQARPVAKKGRTIWIEKRERLEVEVLLLPVANAQDEIALILGSVVKLGDERVHVLPQAEQRIEYGDLAWGTEFGFLVP